MTASAVVDSPRAFRPYRKKPNENFASARPSGMGMMLSHSEDQHMAFCALFTLGLVLFMGLGYALETWTSLADPLIITLSFGASVVLPFMWARLALRRHRRWKAQRQAQSA